MQQYTSKNIVYGSISAGGNVHIGDVTYNVNKEFNQSILFLRIEPMEAGEYSLQLSIKSGKPSSSELGPQGENLLHEAVRVRIPPKLLPTMKQFQTFRRGLESEMRDISERQLISVTNLENQLTQLLFDTFFSGDIGQVCADFIQLHEENHIAELLLAISTDEDSIANLPFEMVLPRLFPPKLGQAKKSLAIASFGLVRTKKTSLESFQLQAVHATAAPLKMLFVNALPENMDERSKMIQIEEEQSRLIRAIGGLEATGDNKPKIVIEFLENASLNELHKALDARRHDILHISGHGAYHTRQNKGVLYFENEDGDEEQITGADLGETLRHHACVKFVVLSACETAISGSEGGVTQQLAKFGVPAIVSMRFAVTDEGAKTFTTELYTKLTDGESLTRAVAYAREALHKAVEQKREQAPQSEHLAEWYTPIIYQNQALGPLIDKDKSYCFPDKFYPHSEFLRTKHSRLIGRGFIGRKRYLIHMKHSFRAGRHICLHGLGGLGKTTLAEAFSNHYDNRNHEIHIFRNGEEIIESNILNIINERFAETNPNIATQLKKEIEDDKKEITTKLQLLIDNYLQRRKTILLFDNMEDVQKTHGNEYQRGISNPELLEFFRYLCENTPIDCHLIFTTRYKIEDLDDLVEHIPLYKLSYAEQYRLLNYSNHLRHIPQNEREKVYSRLDGHPRGYEYLEALLKKDNTFSWQQIADSEECVFENLLLHKVYERLTDREKLLFQLVAVFITRTSLPALAAVSGEPEADLHLVLKSLHDWSLCFLEKEGRFEVHRLTREWMRQQITPTEKLKNWALKAGTYFENQPTWEEIELARSYYEIAEAWIDFARISFHLQGEYERIGLNQRVLELNQSVLEKNIDKKNNSLALSNIGYLLLKTGNYEEALSSFEQCLAIDQEIGDRKGEGATLNNISQVYYARQDHNTALSYLQKSLDIRQEIRDLQGIGNTLSNVAIAIYDLGDYNNALRYLEKSLAIQQETGDRQGEGTTLNNIGQIYHVREDYATALPFLEQSLAIKIEIGDELGMAATLHNMGAIYINYIKDIETATGFFLRSYIILKQLESPDSEHPAKCLRSIREHFGEETYQKILSKLGLKS